jgi:hypothetical protein
MSQKSIILIVVLFALLVGGMFMYAHLKQNEIANPNTNDDPEPAVGEETPNEYPGIERITATHFYEDGTHTLVGEVNMPTPCDLVETEATVMESMPEQVRVDFTVVNNADTCAQVVTPQRFKVSADASETATFSATFAGREVELNLVPAPEGESPEDFELFIKG